MISRREWPFVLVTAVAAVALMQVPYALGYVFAPPDKLYTGLLINIEDVTYLVAIQQGMQGAWQYHIQFTTEPHAPASLYVFYLALGHLARLFHIGALDMWNLARVLCELILFLVVFGFIAAFLRDPLVRRVAYLLALFGSGFDWSLLPSETFDVTGGAPVDFRIPDAHLFFTALTYPHLAIGTALLLVEFWFWLEANRLGRSRYVLAAGLVNGLLGIIYPFLFFLVGGVLGAHWIFTSWQARQWNWTSLKYLLATFALPAPLYAYYAYVLNANAVFRTWNSQAVTLSPNPIHYLLAYGAMIVLGLAVLRSPASWSLFCDERRGDWSFLWIWIAATAVLLYLPINAQRRFVEGIQVPLAILATVGLIGALLPRLRQARLVTELMRRRHYTFQGFQTLVIVGFLLTMSIGNWVVLVGLMITTTLAQPDGLFRPRSEIDAASWLRDHAPRQAAVFADYVTGAFIPVVSENTVFVGHRYETTQFEKKAAEVAAFFRADTDDERRVQLLSDHDIGFVLVGGRERSLGAFDPSTSDYLVRVYSNPDVTIYQFIGETIQ